MTNTTPFLFRYAKQCVSPGRKQNNEVYSYDEELDMVRWLGADGHPVAIDMADAHGPMTKKCDIEKGDDNKDRRMWQ